MATPVFFDSFFEKQAEKEINLGTDTLKLLLSNTAPDEATDVLKADVTEIAAGNGYSAGGITLSVTSSSQTGGVYTLVADDAQLTAAGGAIATFQWVILYSDTGTGDPLIAYWNAGSAQNVPDGEIYIFVFGGYVLRFQAA
jgi:hypothetical protein